MSVYLVVVFDFHLVWRVVLASFLCLWFLMEEGGKKKQGEEKPERKGWDDKLLPFDTREVVVRFSFWEGRLVCSVGAESEGGNGVGN